MKKLYLFLMAMVLTLPTFAQNISEYYGDWTFTFKDMNNGGATVTKVMTLEDDNTLDKVFKEKDGPFFITVFSAPIANGEITFTFQPYEYLMPPINGFYPKLTLYYTDGNDTGSALQTQAFYNIANEELTQVKRKNGSIFSSMLDNIGFKFENYNSSAQTESELSLDYLLTDMQYGVVDDGGSGDDTPITSPEEMAGEWTMDVKIDNAAETTTLALTATYSNGELLFNLPDDGGQLQVKDITADYNSTGNYLLKFVSGYQSENSLGSTGRYSSVSYYYDDENTTDIFGLLNPETKKIEQFFYRSYSGKDQTSFSNIGFVMKVYKSGLMQPSNIYSDTNYQIVSAGMVTGGSSEPESSISVAIDYLMAFPMSLTEAKATAMLDVTAVGYDDYKVWYNLYMDNNVIIDDTEIELDGGDYIAYLENLEFERDYTFNAWATSGDYISPKVSQTLKTGYAPDIRISAKANNVTNTSAEIEVTTNYWDIEYGPVEFTISASAPNAPEVEDITIEDKGTGTFNITGLTGNTQYTYTIGYTAFDLIGTEYEKENAATVTFTTLAPTIELAGISYSETPGGADFTVASVKSEGLAADAEVDVYFQLGEDGTPEMATKSDNGYTYSFTGLESETDYEAIIFAGVGTYGETGFIKGQVYTEEFTTGEIVAEPEITITFPEDFVTFQNSSSSVNITVTVDVEAENIADDAFTVYFYAAAGNLPGNYKALGKVGTKGANGTYTYKMDYENHGRDYTVVVWAKANEGDYETEPVQNTFTTPDKPGVKITSAKAENVTAKTADLVITYEPVGLGEGLTYSVSVTSELGPEVTPVSTTETTVTLQLTGLTPATIYTYNISVGTTYNGSMYQADQPVSFETLDNPYSITLSEISTSQIGSGAIVTVGKVETTGIEEGTQVDVYIELPGVLDAPEMMTFEDGVYTYTFENLEPKTPYEATVFGGVGTYGDDDFLQGEDYTVRFVSGAADTSGIDSVEAVEEGARYFTIDGVEVKNPQPGLYIKVKDNKATKVFIN